MPYIIVVIALVVASVGFTFFQSTHTAVSKTPSEPLAIEHSNVGENASTSVQDILNNEVIPTGNISVETASSEEPVGSPEQMPLTSPVPLPAPSPEPVLAPIPTPIPVPAPAPVDVNTYKDGTYHTQTSYRTPGGQYQIDVTLSVSNDKINNATVIWNAGGGDGYSKAFGRAYQSSVTGKDLETVHPSRIGGASLTTRAFNSALDTIRSQAT